MCGIAGIINFDQESIPVDLLENMNLSLHHRGPDDSGVYIHKNLGLAHRRLSIIDLANGKQPLSNEDGTVWTVFNGEIYNFKELKAKLEQKGHDFKTNCDTEVLVHLYEEEGIEFVNRLNGMFAFAIFDKTKNTLFLIRDRLGQKPLFYFKTNDVFAFASELQALRKHPAMPEDYDFQAIHDYLSLQYIPSPATIYKDVCKLPPAHALIMDMSKRNSNFSVRRYWNVDYSLKTDLSYDDAKQKLYQLLKDSVDKRLMADVPYGAFLSGGIDSTLITGIMTKLCTKPVKTFSIGFDKDNYDERRFANIAVSHHEKSSVFPVEHYEKIVDSGDFDVVKKLVRHYGEPYCDSSMLPTYMLSQFAKGQVTVALSGDGADELFGGYNRYIAMKLARYGDRIPEKMRKLLYKTVSKIIPPKVEERTKWGQIHRMLKVSASTPNKRYLDIINRFSEDMKREIYGDRLSGLASHETQEIMTALQSIATAKHPVEKVMEIDLHSYLHGDILTKVDIASMANSLEVRSPFMDYRVVEFAASLPYSYKQPYMKRKQILKDSFVDFIPEEITSRSKMGFGVPIAAWFRGKWDNVLRENLIEGKAVSNGFLNKEPIEKMISQHQTLKEDFSYPLWSLLMFELFLQMEKIR